MRWESLLRLVADEPLFSASLLLAGRVSEAQTRVQLCRWVKAGRLHQLRRGLYALAPPWRHVEAHPFLVANRLRRGSYVSLQSALAFHGVIPEHVPVVTSVGPGRPETVRNPLGAFQHTHLATPLHFGYSQVEVKEGQHAFVASPEKALLDLVYLTKGADCPEYLAELRLQNTEVMSEQAALELAARSGKPELLRAARLLGPFLAEEPVSQENSPPASARGPGDLCCPARCSLSPVPPLLRTPCPPTRSLPRPSSPPSTTLCARRDPRAKPSARPTS